MLISHSEKALLEHAIWMKFVYEFEWMVTIDLI